MLIMVIVARMSDDEEEQEEDTFLERHVVIGYKNRTSFDTVRLSTPSMGLQSNTAKFSWNNTPVLSYTLCIWKKMGCPALERL